MARRYEFYALVARTISHSFAALTREILFLPLEHKIHIFSPPCNTLYISQNKFLISFDVESLFTNIPLRETIDLAVETIFKHNPEFPISKANLWELFTFATSQIHFLFNGLFYDQCDGVAMGSTLAPILANLFIGYHEEQ